MDLAIMILGFALASYSVVGNDVIQTLGTFLSSNEDRPWWVLWLFAGGIMAVILIMGYLGVGGFLGGDDVAFDRLDSIIKNVTENGEKPFSEVISFWYVLPPSFYSSSHDWGFL